MLKFFTKYEKVMVQALMGMMAFVLGMATIDLGWVIFQDIFYSSPRFLIDSTELLDIFGLFMLIIIGIELLETMLKTYLIPGKAHFEVVLTVAIIAIARKVIILDLKQVDSLSLIGIAGIILALTVGYFFMKKSQTLSESDDQDHD